MDIQCSNYEISIPSDGSERMITFSAYDVASQGPVGGDPLSLSVFHDGAAASLADGTRVVFPNLPPELREHLLRHPKAWVCALVEEGRKLGVQWAGLVDIQLIDTPLA